MKALIIEEALKGLHGHWFQYIRDIVDGGRAAGHEVDVVVHKDACAEILKDLPCRPILQRTVWEGDPRPSGPISRLRTVLSHNRCLYTDLHSLVGKGDIYDVWIAPTVRLDHLLAYRKAFQCFRNRAFGKLVLIFAESVGCYSDDYSQLFFSRKTAPLRALLWTLRPLVKTGQRILATESSGLARQYKKFSGLDFVLVPHVTSLPSLDSYRSNERDEAYQTTAGSVVFGTYGFTRYDKGVDVLQSALKLLPQGSTNHRFVLQWTGDYHLPNGCLVTKDDPLEAGGRVRYIPAFTRSEQYHQCLAHTDVIILPYRKAFYYDKLSRVAIDAALAGLPFIGPQGTWIQEFGDRYGAGVFFQPENPESLAAAILAAANGHVSLKLQAESRMEMTRRAFSAGAFFEAIESASN